MSDQALITKWLRNTEQPVGTMCEVVEAFHADSQGLVLLDRILGSSFTVARFMNHPIFGMNFASYAQTCQGNDITPRGRVFLVIIACRWTTDRREGRVNTIENILQIPLKRFR